MPNLDPPESDVTNYLIETHRGDIDPPNTSIDDIDVRPEVHYDHYGQRGSADLFVKESTDSGTNYYIYEVKSSSALQHSTGANEVLQQYNRMRQYFFQGSDISLPSDSEVHFRLVFTPSTETIRHILENYSMYQAVMETENHPEITDSRGNHLALQSDVCVCPTEHLLVKNPLIPLSVRGGLKILETPRAVWNGIALHDPTLAEDCYPPIQREFGPFRFGNEYRSYDVGVPLETNGFSFRSLSPKRLVPEETYEVERAFTTETIVATLKEIVEINGIEYNDDGVEFVGGFADHDIQRGIQAVEKIDNAGEPITMNAAYQTLSESEFPMSKPLSQRSYDFSSLRSRLEIESEVTVKSIIQVPEYGPYATIHTENPSEADSGTTRVRFRLPAETLGVILGAYQ